MSSRILTHPSLIYPEEITDLLFSMYQNTKQRVKSHIANLNKPIFYTSSEELTIFIFFRHPKNVTIFLIFFHLPEKLPNKLNALKSIVYKMYNNTITSSSISEP